MVLVVLPVANRRLMIPPLYLNRQPGAFVDPERMTGHHGAKLVSARFRRGRAGRDSSGTPVDTGVVTASGERILASYAT